MNIIFNRKILENNVEYDVLIRAYNNNQMYSTSVKLSEVIFEHFFIFNLTLKKKKVSDEAIF